MDRIITQNKVDTIHLDFIKLPTAAFRSSHYSLELRF